MTENNNDFNNNLTNGTQPDEASPSINEVNNVPVENTVPGQSSQQPPQPQDESYYMYNWDGAKQLKPKKKKRAKIFAATVIICLFLTISLIGWSVSMGYIPNPLVDNSSDISAVSEEDTSKDIPEVIKINDENLEYTSDLTELYERVKNSCVTVLTNTSLGSGFVADENGYIITNHHVINNAKTITVTFYDDTKYTAELIGSDSISDIAVLKIEGSGFTPIDIGNSDNLKIGEQVVAIGTPYSIELAGTMNMGIISGIARNIKVTNDAGTVVKTMTLIQTDTSINPGNSGGPLINMAGQIIGINTLKLMNEYEGLGFAIPIKNAVTIINTLIEYGKVEERPDDDFVTASPRLNIIVKTVEDAISSNMLDLSFDPPSGAFVIEVSRRSAIYKAGLETYDIITMFNGVEIDSTDALITELAKYQAGKIVSIKIFRINRNGSGGEYHEFSFRLDSAE